MRTKVTTKINPVFKRQGRAMETLGMIQPNEVKPLTESLDYFFREHERDLFRSEGNSGGVPWKELSDEYAKWKKGFARWTAAANRNRKRIGFKSRGAISNKILQFSGGLRKSLAQKSDPRHVAYGLHQRGSSRVTVTLGTRNRLAAYHGPGRFHNPRLPVRDPMQHRAKDERVYFKVIYELFEKKRKRFVRVANQRFRALRKGAA